MVRKTTALLSTLLVAVALAVCPVRAQADDAKPTSLAVVSDEGGDVVADADATLDPVAPDEAGDGVEPLSDDEEAAGEVGGESAQQPDGADAQGEQQPAGEPAESVTLYRLYNRYTGEHLYTSAADERASLIAIGWSDEGQAWVSPGTSAIPVYRLYNPYSSDHHYTTSASEYDQLASIGWRKEGVAWYGESPADGAPLYRLFNPYVSVGTHHYTSSVSERVRMVSDGWRYEGVAWCGVDAGPAAPATVTPGWVESGGALFHGNDDGTWSTGWQTIAGKTYHFDARGRADTGLADVDGTVYRFASDGSLAYGWQDADGYRYYFDPSTGAMRRDGWFTYDGSTYYLDPTSGALRTGWLSVGGETYFLDRATGALRRDGWFSDGGNTYFLDPTTGVVQHGWKTDASGNTYYFDPSTGAMATSDRWIDGVYRPFSSSGVCLKTGYQVSWGNLHLAARNVTLPSYASGSSWSYVHPCTISANATREQCIEAFISVAYEYMNAGTRWVDNNCGAPGTTVDCSGLVMEGLYAAGMDLTGVAGGDFNPYSKYYWNHNFANTWRVNQTFQPVSLSEIERGDLIYWNGHVAIYLGNGQLIESTSVASNVRVHSLYAQGLILGCARPFPK